MRRCKLYNVKLKIISVYTKTHIENLISWNFRYYYYFFSSIIYYLSFVCFIRNSAVSTRLQSFTLRIIFESEYTRFSFVHSFSPCHWLALSSLPWSIFPIHIFPYIQIANRKRVKPIKQWKTKQNTNQQIIECIFVLWIFWFIYETCDCLLLVDPWFSSCWPPAPFRSYSYFSSYSSHTIHFSTWAQCVHQHFSLHFRKEQTNKKKESTKFFLEIKCVVLFFCFKHF